MKIIMFSMTPLFENQSMGGAQKQLKKVALHLAEQGHTVKILCTRRKDAAEPFHWHHNLEVIPIFRFKQPFPEPYATPPYNIANALQDISDYLRDADRFYNHDGGFIFPYIYQDIPTIISLRSVLFAETIQSGFLFNADGLILPSQHAADVWRHSVGRFFAGFDDRLHIIHNGLDFERYTPLPPTRNMTEVVPLVPGEHHIILYPHRPEAAKGILQTVDIVEKLVQQYGYDDLRVLVPRWIDTQIAPHVRHFYSQLEDAIAERELTRHFVFHEWISDEWIPEYYNLGDVTFALGNYVETFGNTPYESLACGTPAIVANVGAYRGVLTDEHVKLIDYGDVEAAARHTDSIFKEQERTSDETHQWLQANFQQQAMVEAYADVILNAQKLPPLHYQPQPLTDETRFILASWCVITGQGVYHDFLGQYIEDDGLIRCVSKFEDGVTFQQMSRDEIMTWVRAGYLVPVQHQAGGT